MTKKPDKFFEAVSQQSQQRRHKSEINCRTIPFISFGRGVFGNPLKTEVLHPLPKQWPLLTTHQADASTFLNWGQLPLWNVPIHAFMVGTGGLGVLRKSIRPPHPVCLWRFLDTISTCLQKNNPKVILYQIPTKLKDRHGHVLNNFYYYKHCFKGRSS